MVRLQHETRYDQRTGLLNPAAFERSWLHITRRLRNGPKAIGDSAEMLGSRVGTDRAVVSMEEVRHHRARLRRFRPRDVAPAMSYTATVARR